MSYNWNIITKKIYGILGSHGRNLENLNMYDEKGNEVWNPDDANRFFATFGSHDPDLENFTILAALREEGQTSHCDIKTPTLENDEDFDMVLGLIRSLKAGVGDREGLKIVWQDFDGVIDPREEAVNNIKESKDVSKVFGTTRSSFQKIGDAKMIIRHTDTVNEEKHGARTRHIKAIFIENKMGERFSFPHPHLTGARAFARHISNGGTNHDGVAMKIFEMSQDYMSLKRSANRLRLCESSSSFLGAIRESMAGINKRLKRLHGPKGYTTSTQELLGETMSHDDVKVSEIHKSMAEMCSCQEDDPAYQDLGRTARYISPMNLTPAVDAPQSDAGGQLDDMPVMTFSWSRKPDMVMARQDSPAETNMISQIMELVDACTNEVACNRMRRIAEMVSLGESPSQSDIDLIKEAYASGLLHEETGSVPEEQELEEFLSTYDPQVIFSETTEEIQSSGGEEVEETENGDLEIVPELSENSNETEINALAEQEAKEIRRIKNLAGI